MRATDAYAYSVLRASRTERPMFFRVTPDAAKRSRLMDGARVHDGVPGAHQRGRAVLKSTRASVSPFHS